ncbi:MAG: penicillin-binding protein, partial [Paraburkholderia sp.]|nr:penicillin-binding protein [Paraburkholderia sp.]
MPIIKRPHSSNSPAGEDRDAYHRTPGRNTASRDAEAGRRSIGVTIVIWFAGLLATLAVVGALIIGYALVVMGPQLPSLDALTDYRPKVPLRVYTADHVLIGEFG